jgi:hypothetical protein
VLAARLQVLPLLRGCFWLPLLLLQPQPQLFHAKQDRHARAVFLYAVLVQASQGAEAPGYVAVLLSGQASCTAQQQQNKCAKLSLQKHYSQRHCRRAVLAANAVLCMSLGLPEAAAPSLLAVYHCFQSQHTLFVQFQHVALYFTL